MRSPFACPFGQSPGADHEYPLMENAMTRTNEKTTKPRKARTAQQRIADLEAEIARVKQREASREIKADPAVQEAAKLVRAINKARSVAEEAKDDALATAAGAARDAVAGYLEARGLPAPQRRERRTRRKAG